MQIILNSIAKKLASIDRKCYVVGSYCIHKIKNIPFGGDIDLTTDATPDEVRSVLKVVGEIGKKYGTLIISEKGEKFEITTFRKDFGSVNHRKPVEVTFTRNISEDANRRDFTINAIYYDILENTFIDPVGGIQDLNTQVLRFIGDIDSRLDEDILRLLRYVRFLHKYSFRPAQNNYSRIIKHRIGELQDIAIERIKQEFDKILIHPSNTKSLTFLQKIGFFQVFIPELDKLANTPGGTPHHLEGTVWRHTLLVLKELNKIARSVILSSNSVIPSVVEGSLEEYNEKRFPLYTSLRSEGQLAHNQICLYWSALLHDIGKALTVTFDEKGNVHYFNHEHVGADIFLTIAKRWKFSKKDTEDIEWLIRNHLLPHKFFEMRNLKRNKLMLHPLFPVLVLLSHIDSKGKKPKYDIKYSMILEHYRSFLEKYRNTKFFTGKDIIYKYQNLTGNSIGIQLKNLNDQILSKI